MLFGEVFDRFAAESLVSIVARAAFEHALPAEAVDELFAEHAERQCTRELLFSQVVDLMALAADVWVGDRNFCTTRLRFGFVAAGAHFAIRQHGSNLSVRGSGPAIGCGRVETGTVSEGALHVAGEDGTRMVLRRVTVTLDISNRDGTTEIHILADLPAQVSAPAVAATCAGAGGASRARSTNWRPPFAARWRRSGTRRRHGSRSPWRGWRSTCCGS